jgi:DNA-binding MarR family transcriptional regulator
MPTDRPTPAQDDHEAIAGEVFRAATAFNGFQSQLRRALSLNAHEQLAIGALWAHGALTMTELGARIPLSRAAVTTLVDRLEAEGLVQRRGDERDRRRIVVDLTDEAANRTRPVVTPWVLELQELVSQLSRDEWSTIVRFMHDFRELADRHTNQLLARSDADILAQVRA